jgi:hypothetical protein
MSDLLKDVNLLRYYHTSEDMLKDKDYQKNLLHIAFENKVNTLMIVPFFAQIYQLTLSGHADKLALYKQVRAFKTLSLIGGVAFSFYELSILNHKWKYIDRFYPEPTQLQKTLEREAQQFKENKVKIATV